MSYEKLMEILERLQAKLETAENDTTRAAIKAAIMVTQEELAMYDNNWFFNE
jgi:hypothetical protein